MFHNNLKYPLRVFKNLFFLSVAVIIQLFSRLQGTLKIEGRATHKFVYTRLLKFLLYSRAIQIDPCCLVQALYR